MLHVPAGHKLTPSSHHLVQEASYTALPCASMPEGCNYFQARFEKESQVSQAFNIDETCIGNIYAAFAKQQQRCAACGEDALEWRPHFSISNDYIADVSAPTGLGITCCLYTWGVHANTLFDRIADVTAVSQA
jgi:hypothetical protein